MFGLTTILLICMYNGKPDCFFVIFKACSWRKQLELLITSMLLLPSILQLYDVCAAACITACKVSIYYFPSFTNKTAIFFQ